MLPKPLATAPARLSTAMGTVALTSPRDLQERPKRRPAKLWMFCLDAVRPTGVTILSVFLVGTARESSKVSRRLLRHVGGRCHRGLGTTGGTAGSARKLPEQHRGASGGPGLQLRSWALPTCFCATGKPHSNDSWAFCCHGGLAVQLCERRRWR